MGDSYMALDLNPGLEHHGIKGQKWGVRRTPAQLGHAVANGTRAAFGYFAKAGKSVVAAKHEHDARKVAKRDAKLAKQAAKVNALEQKNALHAREVAAKNAAFAAKHPHLAKHQQRKAEQKARDEAKKAADNSARQQAIRNVKYGLMSDAMRSAGQAAGKMLMMSIVNNSSSSDGVKQFAKYMGGEKKKPDNSLDILKTKSLNDLSDEQLVDVTRRLNNLDKSTSILDKHRPKYPSLK